MATESQAYIYGLELYFMIRLNRASASLKDTLLSSIPNMIEHYDKEQGFLSREDSDAFFRFADEGWRKNRRTFVAFTKKMPHADVLIQVLKTPVCE